MALTSQQIERYSRQIIVSGIGGLGQERLLGSRLILAGSLANVEPVLTYLVGAGVGAISLQTPERDRSAIAGLLDRMRLLNSDVTISCAPDPTGGAALALVLISDDEQIDLARAACRRAASLVFVRLDAPARIAVFPSPPPCPLCAASDLHAPFARRADNAGFVAMAAAAIALAALASGDAIARAPTLIEFDGYRTMTSMIDESSISAGCSCGVRSAS